MPVRFLEQSDREALNDFIYRQSDGSLFQTWEWGEFQKRAGFKVWRLGFEEGSGLASAATVLKYDMPGGKWYLYSPRLVQNAKCKVQNAKLLERVGEIGRREKCLFFRLDPLIEEGEGLGWLGEIGAVQAPKEIQPKSTIIVDLAPSENEILARMKPKWRYNIRLAARKSVTVRLSDQAHDLDEFYRLAQVTARRDKFHIHEKKYYQALLETLGPQNLVRLFVAEYRDKTLAVIFVSFYRETATYMHGASSDEYRNLMAPHLLQWEAMREGKRRGGRQYDLYGVAPLGDAHHPWAGVTRFKEGFGGKRVDYIGAYDIVYDKFWYNMMKWAMRVIRNR